MTNEQTDQTWISDRPDDDELARAIAPLWCARVRFIQGTWHVYENGCWIARSSQEMQMGLRDKLREFRRLRAGVQINISQARVAGLARMMEGDLLLPDREMTALVPKQEQYINLRNGLYNLDTFALEPHNPELRFTTQLDFEYDPDAKCPTWEGFLNTSLQRGHDTPDEDLINLVQEAMAYSMTARTDMKASFWLVGVPDSGKSTLIAFLKDMMGSMHGTIDLNQLGGNRFLLSGIVGKRIVTFTEASDSVVLPDAIYKAMVGGVDEIYTDVKNRQGIAFKPIAKFWWAMNNPPRMTDRSGATMNRLKVIPFNHAVPVSRRITNLTQRLMQERAGVFNWMLDGYIRLAENGAFTVSEQSEVWRANYQLENDTEKSFVAEWCELHNDYRVQAERLYQHYKRWSEMNGFRPKNSNQVAKEWTRLGFQRGATHGLRYWYGLRINPKLDEIETPSP